MLDENRLEHIKYKANTLNYCFKEFGEHNKITDDNYCVVDMYDAFLSILEDLDIYDEILTEKEYYVLPLDAYNQPNGMVEKRMLTPYEAKQTHYCFTSYKDAIIRAMD